MEKLLFENLNLQSDKLLEVYLFILFFTNTKIISFTFAKYLDYSY
jgi:hypothetical protein